MMLLNNLFTLSDLQTDGNLTKANIHLNPAHDIFKGHFPGQPVLPGVCMMQIVKEVLELHFEKQTRLIKAADLKFLSFIDPVKTPTIVINLKLNADVVEIKVDAQLLNNTTTYFKFKGVFTV